MAVNVQTAQNAKKLTSTQVPECTSKKKRLPDKYKSNGRQRNRVLWAKRLGSNPYMYLTIFIHKDKIRNNLKNMDEWR